MNKERELELVLEQCREVVDRKIPLLVLAPEYTKILLDYIEELGSYKLLYQKVKDRNDKAIEYNKELAKLYDIGSMERSNADTNLLILGDEQTIRKLKGNNEEQ